MQQSESKILTESASLPEKTSLQESLGGQNHWTAQQLQQATNGQWQLNGILCDLSSDNDSAVDPKVNFDVFAHFDVNKITTDNRQVQANDIFLALSGERFDGHDFVADAVARGAIVVIVSRPIAQLNAAQLIVADTRLALGHLGAYRRQQNSELKVLALTGSSGKTTVKEMLGSILRISAPTLVTRGNLNNDLGVPLMLLELQPEHCYAVMELGANHVGEIDYTCNLVQPCVAGVLNIGTAHMGEFGGRLGIANAKSEIFNHLTTDGIAIVPAQDDFSDIVQHAAAQHKTISFGVGGDVSASNISLLPDSSRFNLHSPHGQIKIDLPFAGQHNIENALAAASFALAIDIPLPQIAQGLATAQGAKGRLNFMQQGNWLIIDDTYNANPHAMRAAAQVLAAQSGAKILVLGDIGELGDAAVAEHFALGQDLAKLPLDAIFSVGEFASHTIAGVQSGSLSNASSTVASSIIAQAFTSKAELLLQLRQFLAKSGQASILFKGSRYTKMESLIADLGENT